MLDFGYDVLSPVIALWLRFMNIEITIYGISVCGRDFIIFALIGGLLISFISIFVLGSKIGRY